MPVDSEAVIEPEVLNPEDRAMNIEAMVRGNVSVDLKGMEPEARGEILHRVSTSLIHETNVKDIAWLKLGLYWAFVVKNRLYKFAGPHIRSQADFVKELDLGIKLRELQNYADLALIFTRTLREKNVEVPIRKLLTIKSVIKNNAGQLDEWVDKAIALPMAALEDEVREAKGLPARDTCVHPEAEQEVWIRCGHCGKWLEKVRTE